MPLAHGLNSDERHPVGHSKGEWTLSRFHDRECGGGEDWFRLSADSTLDLEITACSDGFQFGQNEANACLLWAAPRLLAACVAAEACLREAGMGRGTLGHQLRAAIEDATLGPATEKGRMRQ